MGERSRTRNTTQQSVVYDAVKRSTSHPTAGDVLAEVRATFPAISLGTVYRNLSTLKRQGLVRELRGLDRLARFEVNGDDHSHFVCTGCGAIRDVAGASLGDWHTLADLVGCEVDEQRVEFHGRCPVCLRGKND